MSSLVHGANQSVCLNKGDSAHGVTISQGCVFALVKYGEEITYPLDSEEEGEAETTALVARFQRATADKGGSNEINLIGSRVVHEAPCDDVAGFVFAAGARLIGARRQVFSVSELHVAILSSIRDAGNSCLLVNSAGGRSV